jgi:hypothetical protein
MGRKITSPFVGEVARRAGEGGYASSGRTMHDEL